MNNQKMLLNKLLSNDVTIVNEAVTALIGHANLQKKWTLRVIETAIKQMAGKENIKFYSPQSAMLVEPHAAAMQLGEIIHYNLMFEDVARTQRLIIHSKKAKEEMEYYIKGSGKENKVRIMYAILGVQMQMRIILAQNKYVGDYCSYCGNHLLSGHDECDVCGRVKGSIIATGTFLGSLGMLPLSAGLFVLGKLIFSGKQALETADIGIIPAILIGGFFLVWGVGWTGGIVGLLINFAKCRRVYNTKCKMHLKK